MDSKVAKWLLEAIRFAAVIVTVVVYLERRLGNLELADAIQEERSKVNASRLDRLDTAANARLDVGADGGFGNPAVRSLVNQTIREQTKDHVTRTDLDRLRAEQDAILKRLVEANALKPAH